MLLIFSAPSITPTLPFPALPFLPPSSLSLSLPPSLPSSLRSEVSQVNTSQQLAELQKTHPVIYIFADDGELDPDWKAIYMKLANEKILRARYLYTTNPDVLKVRLGLIPKPLRVWEQRSVRLASGNGTR